MLSPSPFDTVDKQSDATSTSTSLGRNGESLLIADPDPPQKFGGRTSQINKKFLLFRLFNRRDTWNKYGKLTTFCKGTIILAPVKLWWWMAQFYILITCIIFSMEFFYYNWVALVPAVIIAVLEWMAFFKTCLSDPGILPRPPFVDAVKTLLNVLYSHNSRLRNGLPTIRIITHPNGQQEKLQYCWMCHHFRSLHTSHCSDCDCCMIQHDHHCPVYGGCVAKNNNASFHTMVITMAGFWMYMLGYSIFTITSPRAFVGKRQFGVSQDPTPITFYVVVAEVFTVITIPLIVKCICHINCCYSQGEPVIQKRSDDKNAEILKFAVDNNFTALERQQLNDILEVALVQAELKPQEDLNHNNFENAKIKV